jgi:membrane protein implicated in regulation of membrane protease activity
MNGGAMDTNGARAYNTPGEQEPSPAEALQRLQEQIGELQTYLAHFISAKIDSLILPIRQLGIWAVLGVVGLIALAGLIVAAIVLLLIGAAAGLGLLFDGNLWLGQIVVGGGVLALLSLSVFIGVRSWQRRALQQKVQKYDERQLQQRTAFGHNVADRATHEATL